MRHSIEELNFLSAEDFTSVVAPVFEHSPWIARETAPRRPFAGIDDLHRRLCDTVRRATDDQKLALIRAHPDLVGRVVLTAESAREQAVAGLSDLTPEEIALFQKQNAAYRAKFEFPFIICARLNKKDAILAGFSRRLQNSREQEIGAALEEIFKIAGLRLRDLISSHPMPAKLSTHVLDTSNGCPAAQMQIELWSCDGPQRRLLKTVRTNADGRPDKPLLDAAEMKSGEYELIFFVGDYFSKKANAPQPAFLTSVPVRFCLGEANASYHIPLLCSPWSYSTYRGS